MLLGMGLLVLKYAVLASLLLFVALTLRQMIQNLPIPASESLPRQTSASPKPTSSPQAPPAPVKPAPAPSPPPPRRPWHPHTRRKEAPQAIKASAALVVVEPGVVKLKPGAIINISDKTHIGRAPNNTIVLDDPHVSRSHAFIGRRGDTWIIVDKGSSNGTFLNGRRLARPVALRDGDLITLGTVTFSFRLPPPQE